MTIYSRACRLPLFGLATEKAGDRPACRLVEMTFKPCRQGDSCSTGPEQTKNGALSLRRLRKID